MTCSASSGTRSSVAWGPSLKAPADDAAAAEQRLAAYVESIVLPFGLCPWARAAWVEGHTRTRVTVSAEPAVEEVIAFARGLEQDTRVAIGFFLAPAFAGRPAAWERAAERAREALNRAGSAWHLAAFHPSFPEVFATPAALVSSLRRSPDPLFQLVAVSALDAVGQDREAVSAAVGERNFATATARADELRAAFQRLHGARALS